MLTFSPRKLHEKEIYSIIKLYFSMTEVYDGYTNKLKIWDDVVKLTAQQKKFSIQEIS